MVTRLNSWLYPLTETLGLSLLPTQTLWLMHLFRCLSPVAAIDSCIQYRLVSLCYSYKDSTMCGYLTELLKAYKPPCLLRTSSDTAILCLPSVCMHMYAWSVSYAALYIWYSLLWKVWSSDTLTSFRSWLKSHIFKLSYWLPVHMCKHVCSYKLVFYYILVLCFVMGYISICSNLEKSHVRFKRIHYYDYIIFLFWIHGDRALTFFTFFSVSELAKHIVFFAW